MNGPGTVNNRTQVQVPLDQNETIYIDNVMPNVFNTAVAVLKTGTTVDVEKFLGGTPNQTLKVRVEGAVTLKYNIGGMGSILTNTGADKLLFAGRIYGFTYVNDNWYEQDDSATGGGGGTTSFPLTINSSNTGVASPALFDGSVGVTISANTVGAVSLSGSYADPTWITSLDWSKITGVPGFVVGPASATDNALARYDLTTGKLIQNSNAILEDNGVLKVAAGILVGTGTTTQNDPQDSNFSAETLYVDSVNARVGIGTDTPEATLSIHSQGTGNVRGVSGRHWDNTTAFSHFKYIGGRARGSVGSPSAVLDQDSLTAFIARGYKTTDWSTTVGGLYIYAEGNWTDASTPTSIRLRGVTTGTTVEEWFKFNRSGISRSIVSNWIFEQTTSNSFVFSTNGTTRLTVGAGITAAAGFNNTGYAITTSQINNNTYSSNGSSVNFSTNDPSYGILFSPNSVTVLTLTDTSVTIGTRLVQNDSLASLVQSTTSATLNIGSGSGSSSSAIVIRRAAGQQGYIHFSSGVSLRWTLGAATNAESGADAGSSFVINAYTDAGAFIDTPVTIARAAGGVISLARNINHTGAVANLGNQTGGSALVYIGTTNTPGTALIIRGTVAGGRYTEIATNTSVRWRYGASNTAESGSDAGSNFYITAFTDAGATIDTPISIVRASGGLITLVRSLTQSANSASLAQSTGAATVNIGTGTGSSSTTVTIRSAAGQQGILFFRTGSSNRWALFKDSNAESGANAGSTLRLAAYADGGTYIDDVINIVRASGGTMTLSRPISQSAVSASLAQSSTTADLAIGTGAGSSTSRSSLRSAAGQYAIRDWRSGTSVRWQITKDNDAESGANAGSTMRFQAFDDAGAFLDNWMSVVRASGGAVTITRPITASNLAGTGTRMVTATSTGLLGTSPIGATVADPTGGATIDAEARTAINAIIDRLQAHGLIA